MVVDGPALSRHSAAQARLPETRLRFQPPLINPGMRFSRTRLSEVLHLVAVGVAVYHMTVPTNSCTPRRLQYARL